MLPHPEGGYYKETYRSVELIPSEALPPRFPGARSLSTAILFLLEAGQFSAFHRIQSDEVWHFYSGGALDIYEIRHDGLLSVTRMGCRSEQGEVFQHMVPAGAWFASRPAPESAFSLVGCTVSPGFDFADFELAQADVLAQAYPSHEKTIRTLCRS